jgi:hypothetical protein
MDGLDGEVSVWMKVGRGDTYGCGIFVEKHGCIMRSCFLCRCIVFIICI